jgi:peptidoglycan hydrolase-like protein with peptidoglycan-binding domain
MIKALGSLVALAGLVALSGPWVRPAQAGPAGPASTGAPSETIESTDGPDLDEAPSYVDLVADAQRLLSLQGFDPGPIDGQLGLRTRQAIRAYQAEARSRGILEALKGPATAGAPERLEPVRVGQAASAASN